MNILFLTLSRINDIDSRGIYTDLMREFVKRGDKVFIASPTERRFGKKTHLIKNDNVEILKVRTLNIQKTNAIEKGVGTLLLSRQFDKAIRKYWGEVRFDLVLYATPPITFNKVIQNIKNRCGCPSYLMLKDIFPQNAVDLGMMKKNSFLYKMFRKKEKELYRISDRIGCMSPANCQYVIDHNPDVDKEKIELCPNAIHPVEYPSVSLQERNILLDKLRIPTDKTLFIYGGNLGKPQGVDFLLRVVEENESLDNSFIVIVGSGTEYGKIRNWFDSNTPQNALLLSALPKDEYDKLVRVCDVGLIFLDPRFTIPNFPSRLLSYLENSMPVLLATDLNTDVGKIAETNGYGFWCESGDIDKFMTYIKNLCNNKELINQMGDKGLEFLNKNYSVESVIKIILKINESI